MPAEFPTSLTSPPYVATVVGLLAFGVVVAIAASSPGEPTPETVANVVVAVTLPATLAYVLADRLG